MSTVAAATASDRRHHADEAARARAGAAPGSRPAIEARIGQHVTDIARGMSPGNAVVQEQIADFLRARFPSCFDSRGDYVGGELVAPTREELDDFLAAGASGAARPAGGRAPAEAPRPGRPVGDSAAQEALVDQAVQTYAEAIRRRMDVGALSDATGALGLPQPVDSATIAIITTELHDVGGARVIGPMTRGTDPDSPEARVVDTLHSLEPGQATEVAERVGEELCRGMGLDPASARGRGVIRAVRDGMATEIEQVIRSGPGNQYAPAAPLTESTDADAWMRSEAGRVRAAAGGSRTIQAHLDGRLREAVAMRDWLQSLPRDEQGLRGYFYDMARREGGTRPGEAVRFVMDLRAEVERCGGDYYAAYMRQAPETRRFIRDEQPSELTRCR